MQLFLFDTVTVSRLIRNDSELLREKCSKLKPAQIAISAVTEGELLYGLARKPEATRLHEKVLVFLNQVESLAWTTAAAREYARLRHTTEARGIATGSFDMLIAAHAVATNRTLITGDKNLLRLAGWLRVEDWTANPM